MNNNAEIESDYDTALKRNEQLMDAEQGTPEDEELNALVAPVVAYEDIHYPIGENSRK